MAVTFKMIRKFIQVSSFFRRKFIDLCFFVLCFSLAAIEEFVAGSAETFPDLVRIFIRNAANGFPFFLQLDQLFFGSIPVSAVFYGFSLFAKLGLQLQI